MRGDGEGERSLIGSFVRYSWHWAFGWVGISMVLEQETGAEKCVRLLYDDRQSLLRVLLCIGYDSGVYGHIIRRGRGREGIHTMGC